MIDLSENDRAVITSALASYHIDLLRAADRCYRRRDYSGYHRNTGKANEVYRLEMQLARNKH